MPNSSDVISGTDATAAEYNSLRKDVPKEFAKVYKNQSFSVTIDGTWNLIIWDATEFDTANMVDLINYSDRITIQLAGKYRITSQITFNNMQAQGIIEIRFKKNGVVVHVETFNTSTGGNNANQPSPKAWNTFDCALNDYFTVECASLVTSNSLVGDAAYKTFFLVERVGA